MYIKKLLALVVLVIVVCCSCNKSNNNNVATTPTTVANLDSIVGYYYGITSGDSIFSYTDTNGIVHEKINSFSLPDTLIVTSPDTINIVVTSKFYTMNFSYGDSLTIDSITYLQNTFTGQSAAVIQTQTFSDTANAINHIGISIQYGYTKNLTSYFMLYKR